VLVVVLKQCSALCNGSCHDSQCVKHTFVITHQYNGASHLQNYSSCNTGWWSNLKHSYLLPQSYTELLDLTKRNTMWNNSISSQVCLHTSHRTEHDIWSFTVSVHPICILRVTELMLLHIIIMNINFLKNSILYATLLTQNTTCTADYNFCLKNSSNLVVVLLCLQVKWQSRSPP
jgi:hypothetical protein